MGFSLYNIPPSLLEKINNLYNLLLQRKRVYEQVSAAVPNKEFHDTLLTLAQESSQYAGELSFQVQTFGIIWKKEKTYTAASRTILQDENEIMRFCKRTEIKIAAAYYAILNELNLYEEIKKMMRYQLNSVLYTFMKLKLINALRSH
jgi:hypothetical protein